MKSTESEIDSLTAPGISLAQYQQLEVEVNTLQVSLSRSVHGLYWPVLSRSVHGLYWLVL